MMRNLRNFWHFVVGSLKIILKGGVYYWAWILFLLVLLGVGGFAYIRQLSDGLIVTNMRDQVSWGFYIGNFTFLVGVAAAAVVLVIPAYVYHWGSDQRDRDIGGARCHQRLGHVHPIRHRRHRPSGKNLAHDTRRRLFERAPVHFGLGCRGVERLSVSQPLYRHLYSVLSIFVRRLTDQELCGPWSSFPSRWPLAFTLSPPLCTTECRHAPSGIPPYFAPRFLVSAFCSGPAILIVILQILRKTTRLEIKDEAIWKIAELMAYAMFINLYLQLVDIFKEFYSNTEHTHFARYMFFGLGDSNAVAPFALALTGIGHRRLLPLSHTENST